MITAGDHLLCKQCGALWATATRDIQAGELIEAACFRPPANHQLDDGMAIICWECNASLHFGADFRNTVTLIPGTVALGSAGMCKCDIVTLVQQGCRCGGK